MTRTLGLKQSESPREEPLGEEIRRQLENILSSPQFHTSKRCQQFLAFVCEKALCGEAGTLKERTLATEVFGRPPESNLGDDTIVRVGAREVRKRLAQYYMSPDGLNAVVAIDLPSGSYAPEFRYLHAPVEAPDESGAPATAPLPESIALPARPWLRWIAPPAILLVIVLSVAAVVLWSRTGQSPKAFSLFWKPVFTSGEPLLLAVGHPLVYHPSIRAQRMNEELLPQSGVPAQHPIQVPPNKLSGSDWVPVFNQYVGFGDLVAANEVSTMLARRGKDVRVRLASSTPFADLRQPVLLIGAITNRWTMELGRNWRFQFTRENQGNLIIDTQAEPGRQQKWGIPRNPNGTTSEDFLLISRIVNSPTGGLLLVAAGVKQFGTEAAGRLLADPHYLNELLTKLPAGWEDRNLQIVLHSQVIGNAPAQPELVAWHLW